MTKEHVKHLHSASMLLEWCLSILDNILNDIPPSEQFRRQIENTRESVYKCYIFTDTLAWRNNKDGSVF